MNEIIKRALSTTKDDNTISSFFIVTLVKHKTALSYNSCFTE